MVIVDERGISKLEVEVELELDATLWPISWRESAFEAIVAVIADRAFTFHRDRYLEDRHEHQLIK
jgi:hypothetical protein